MPAIEDRRNSTQGINTRRPWWTSPDNPKKPTATPKQGRARGLTVMPFCPFIAAYIERDIDEYGDLVAPEMFTAGRP
jgi:hypothetical protein